MNKEVDGVFYDGVVCPFCGKTLALSLEVYGSEGILFLREKLVKCDSSGSGCGSMFVIRPHIRTEVALLGEWKEGTPKK